MNTFQKLVSRGRALKGSIKRRFAAAPVQKTYEEWQRKGYIEAPEVSFIIQSHNKGAEVVELVKNLRQFSNCEILVIDDGSDISHTQILGSFLDRGNEFLIRCNDLYEVITYDRSIYWARGKYLALLQDDDEYPDDSWVERAVSLFREHNDMVILGGLLGGTVLPYEKTEGGKMGGYEFANGIGARSNLFKYDLSPTMASSPEKAEFKFVNFVNRAPMWVNRDLFLERLGHIDQQYAPFHTDDMEICLRAWLKGLKVGWYNSNVKTSAKGDGGMRLWNQQLHLRQIEHNYKLLYLEYQDKLEEIHQLTYRSNSEL